MTSIKDVAEAAGVAAYYSRARHDTSVEVDITPKKYVRAIKGAAPGLVSYRKESTLRVAPEMPDAEISFHHPFLCKIIPTIMKHKIIT